MNPMPEMVDSKSKIAATERVDAFLRRNQTWIVVALCCFASIRILTFAAAFPLFNNVDEQDHYEMVYRFAHGYMPEKELPLIDPKMARVFTLYGTHEYFIPAATLRSVRMDIPIAELPGQMKEVQYQRYYDHWTKQRDIEAQSPPVYYMVAGVWLRIGEVLGLKDFTLAYWVRFMNAVVYAMFVWISFLFMKEVLPGNEFLRVAVPMFLAFFPQDIFYGMNRDILSPLLSALVLLLLFQGLKQNNVLDYGLIAGAFLVGISFLTEVSNFVLFAVLAMVLYILGAKADGRDERARKFTVMVGAAIAGLLPPLLWMFRNRLILGDFTGSKAKTSHLGWTVKPWLEMWHHPIFSLSGMNRFLGDLIPVFWRGEYYWWGNPLKWQIADRFYVISSYVFIAVFAMYLLRNTEKMDRLERLSAYVSLYLVVASVLFLAAISLPYDFHQCFYPSRAYPYFVSGRIVNGSLLPFALIYLIGFEYLWQPIRKYVHPIFPLLAICVFIVCVEISIRATVFHSNFNFFSLRGI
jgi:hypothetical protein